MPNWGEVLKTIQGTIIDHPLDVVRWRYLKAMSEYTERNVISYYSGFLQKGNPGNATIDDNDKNAFMHAVHKLDKQKGLDLILHTPGGDIAATESIVVYLKEIFGKNIRAIVPQIAMSAGTMIALSCTEIIMGKESNIGPIDPQFGGMSCAAVLEEFEKALANITENQAYIPLWQPIISKYHPTFLGDCKKATEWSEAIVKEWLIENMFYGDLECNEKAKVIVDKLSSHEETKSHSRHIHIRECIEYGIKVTPLEGIMKGIQKDECDDFQDCVLTLHHTYMHTFANTPAIKIVENHLGNAMVTHMHQEIMR